MRANMKNIMPVFASVGVGLAAYQMFSGNGGNMKNIMPLASSMMGMGNGQGQNQQQQGNQ